MSGVETHEGQRAISCVFFFFLILEGGWYSHWHSGHISFDMQVDIISALEPIQQLFFYAWSCATVALQRKLIHRKIMLFTDDMYTYKCSYI